MIRRLITGCVVFLALAVVSSGLAQDAKDNGKKESKPTVTTDVKKDAKPAPAATAKKSTKPPTFKFVSCSQPGCGFWAKSHSRKELESIIKKHSKRHHKTVLTDKQAKDLVKQEGTK